LKPTDPYQPIEVEFLSERHPEKQGLKLVIIFPQAVELGLSERHPEKQGLKLNTGVNVTLENVFQSAIQKNKD